MAKESEIVEGKHPYGVATVGYGKLDQREIPITEFVSANFKNNRLINVVKLEDETFIISVENPPSSGREPQQNMRLSLESLIGLVTTLLMYQDMKGMKYLDHLQNAVNDGQISYNCSDNLTPISNTLNS